MTTSFRLALLLSVGCTLLPAGHAADLERGKLLYENHCQECHESVVHVRHDRRARFLAELYWQTTRWATDRRLPWGYSEVEDVVQYLNSEYYKFNARVECR